MLVTHDELLSGLLDQAGGSDLGYPLHHPKGGHALYNPGVSSHHWGLNDLMYTDPHGMLLPPTGCLAVSGCCLAASYFRSSIKLECYMMP